MDRIEALKREIFVEVEWNSSQDVTAAVVAVRIATYLEKPRYAMIAAAAVPTNKSPEHVFLIRSYLGILDW